MKKLLFSLLVLMIACKKKCPEPISHPSRVPITYNFKVYNVRPSEAAKMRRNDDTLVISVNRVEISHTKYDTTFAFTVNLNDTVSVFWYPGYKTTNRMRISLNGSGLFICDTAKNTNFKYIVH